MTLLPTTWIEVRDEAGVVLASGTSMHRFCNGGGNPERVLPHPRDA